MRCLVFQPLVFLHIFVRHAFTISSSRLSLPLFSSGRRVDDILFC